MVMVASPSAAPGPTIPISQVPPSELAAGGGHPARWPYDTAGAGRCPGRTTLRPVASTPGKVLSRYACVWTRDDRGTHDADTTASGLDGWGISVGSSDRDSRRADLSDGVRSRRGCALTCWQLLFGGRLRIH